MRSTRPDRWSGMSGCPGIEREPVYHGSVLTAGGDGVRGFGVRGGLAGWGRRTDGVHRLNARNSTPAKSEAMPRPPLIQSSGTGETGSRGVGPTFTELFGPLRGSPGGLK